MACPPMHAVLCFDYWSEALIPVSSSKFLPVLIVLNLQACKNSDPCQCDVAGHTVEAAAAVAVAAASP